MWAGVAPVANKLGNLTSQSAREIFALLKGRTRDPRVIPYRPNLLMQNCARCTCSASQLISNKKRLINTTALPKPATSTLRSLL
jgi:hypothetical protein